MMQKDLQKDQYSVNFKTGKIVKKRPQKPSVDIPKPEPEVK